MLTLSEVLIKEYKIKTYKDLKEFISKKIDEGEIFLSLDIKPSFDDTPDNYLLWKKYYAIGYNWSMLFNVVE